MTDLALSLIIFLSALSGAFIGFIYGYFYGEDHANRANSTAFHSHDSGHRSGEARGNQMLAGWESCSVLPVEAQGKLASDRYPRFNQ